MAQLRLALLGPLQAVVDDEPVSGLSSAKIQALLAYLALERRPHPRGALAELLWPERPAGKAGQNLRQSLSRLKRALERSGATGFIRATRQTLALNPEADVWLDVDAFTAAVDFARDHDHQEVESCGRCAARLEEAVALYRGDFLQELLAESAPFEEWVILQREWLHGRALQALGHLAAHYIKQGNYRAAQNCARRQIELEPWLERGHRQLMHALAGMGRRSEALAAYDACRQALAEALDVTPSEQTRELYEAIRREKVAGRPAADILAAGISPPAAPAHNLPRQFTPFVGREQEEADIHDRLDRETCALLTILGPGGVGKTRLAVEVAKQRLDGYGDGVWFASLAAVGDPSLAPVAVANQLDLTLSGTAAPADQLIDHLRSRHLLLLLDNVEHLLGDEQAHDSEQAHDGLDWLLDLLRAAPDVQLLVTSRMALNFRAEWLYEVAGLPYPPTPETAGSYAAPKLFTQLGQRLRPDFRPDAEWAAIVRICQLVEGMPLALELAAAQLPGTGCEQIASAIARNLDHLATTMADVPARQRSLRAVFTSSWDLLTAEEQAVLPRLSSFAGGFTADAATAVAGATPDLLERLLDKSFLRPDDNERYQMHEVLRHYAAEALVPDAAAAVSARHAAYYADFTAAQHKLLNSDRQKEALVTMGRDFDNVMAAWRWALEQAEKSVEEPEEEPADRAESDLLLGRFTDGLWAYLDDRGLYRDGLALFERALTSAPQEPATEAAARVWTYLRMAAGFFHQRLGQYPQARRHYERCLETYRRLEDLAESGHCLYYLGAVAGNAGRLEDALDNLREALAIYQRLESDRHVANIFTKMGSVLELMGRYDEAEQILRQALALKREAKQPIGVAISLNNLALLLWRTGQYDEAEAHFREALAINREIGNVGNEASCLSNLGRLFITRGEYRQAEALLQESLALEQTVQAKRHTATVLNNLGLVTHLLGDGRQARAYLAQSLALARETGNRREAAYAHLNQARILLDDGDVEGAAGSLRRTLRWALELRLTPLALAALVQAARLALVRGETARAGALLQLSRHHPAAWRQTQTEARALATERGLIRESDPIPTDEALRETLADLVATL